MRDLFGLQLLSAKDKAIAQLKRQHRCSVHGQKVWRSASLMLDYLNEYPLAAGLNILEIGAGWGLVGIYCAKHFNARVTALDVDPQVFPYLQLHAQLNQVIVAPLVADYQTLGAQQLAQFDLVLGSDICFWDQLAGPLTGLIQTAKGLGRRVIIADPGRPPFIEVIETLLAQDQHKALALENWSVPHPYNVNGLILDTGAPYVEL